MITLTREDLIRLKDALARATETGDSKDVQLPIPVVQLLVECTQEYIDFSDIQLEMMQ